jgi:hypothetical protein
MKKVKTEGNNANFPDYNGMYCIYANMYVIPKEMGTVR